MTVASRMVEFNRFGAPQSILRPGERYIRTAGWDSVARELSATLEHETVIWNLNALRYEGFESSEDAEEARQVLGLEAERFLETIEPTPGHLLQVDLVTNAAELWAFPFEAAFARRPQWIAQEHEGVVITRRIRGSFTDATTPWPPTPTVLFAHAPVTADLEGAFVQAHVDALSEALAPWSAGKPVTATGLLHVREVASANELAKYREELKPAYVHLLAHGAATRPNPRLREVTVWGLRLGYEDEPGTPPGEIAAALTPNEGFPLVVTLAACDSANQGDPAFHRRSIVQELHYCGVPVVIGSQLPLTKAGSLVLARAFYRGLLRGDDVRVALHAARVKLHADAEAGHDWLSLVGYVRLPPEGYAAHLEEFGLRLELRLLDAAQQNADRLSGGERDGADFAEVERNLLERLHSLEQRKARLTARRDLLEECSGLQASAYKRLSELLFERGRRQTDTLDADWQRSREALAKSLACYRSAWEGDLGSHWLGVQRLALELILTGRISSAEDWLIVRRAARIASETVRNGLPDFWSCGTLMELALIAEYAEQPRDLATARASAALFAERARKANEPWAIDATRRQLRRYVNWWTGSHGYFPGTHDLAADAAEVLKELT